MLGVREQDAARARVGANGNEQLLYLNQAKVDQLKIDAIGDEEFTRGSEHRVSQFGKFI